MFLRIHPQRKDSGKARILSNIRVSGSRGRTTWRDDNHSKLFFSSFTEDNNAEDVFGATRITFLARSDSLTVDTECHA
jgi:hypothetical protein